MTITEKIKTIDNKIEQIKAQYDLERKTEQLGFQLYYQKILVNMNF